MILKEIKKAHLNCLLLAAVVFLFLSPTAFAKAVQASISLKQASTIIKAALSERHTLHLKPITVAVLDSGGHLVALQREDNSSILRPKIAIGKAWTALSMGMSSRKVGAILSGRVAFINALSNASKGRFMPVPGGLLIHNQEGHVIGAVGISGDTSDNDERCAKAGVSVITQAFRQKP